MNLLQRINAFEKLGTFFSNHLAKNYDNNLLQIHQAFDQIISGAGHHNNWFSVENIHQAVSGISLWLNAKSLSEFINQENNNPPKTIAVIGAGNIPLVCFHDVMCVLLTGNNLLIKMSSDDNVLLPFVLKTLVFFEPEFENQILFAASKLRNFDAVIATGSNNSAKHFEYYFSKYPRIIRQSRTSVAILRGDETAEDLKKLAVDIFSYFGFGCRNVSKLLVPENYNFNLFFESMIGYAHVIHNNKYNNNYTYQRAIYLLEQIKFLDNNFLILRENESLHSPVSVLYYQHYSSQAELSNYLDNFKNELQCIVGKNYIPFGYSQMPVISQFADHVNTLHFLLNL